MCDSGVLRAGPILALLLTCACAGSEAPPEGVAASFTGSEACASCHQDIYDRWRETLMANVLQDPHERPEAVVGDFTTPDPLVTFSLDDVAFTYGSKWKQRYFTRRGNDLFVFPAQWDVRNRQWRRYHPAVGADWWAELYPDDQMQRPTGPLCDGCHSVNYDLATRTVTEWNVGCEACHGPGSTHVAYPEAAMTIVNPAKLDRVRADDICIQCHSQGQPRANPIGGEWVDWPVGFRPGERLSEVWHLDQPDLGEETFTHWPEGTAHKNRMQGNDFVQSRMSEKGVRCYGCHDVHGTPYDADLRLPGNDVCLQCHGPQQQAGPAGTLEHHTQHVPDSEGSLCVNCHMPLTARTVGDVSVRSHTFTFVTPGDTERYGIPNACTSCHADQTLAWATEALRRFPEVSPWRVPD